LSWSCRDSLAECQQKAMTQIESASSTLQNQSHKPRGTIHSHACLGLAEIP